MRKNSLFLPSLLSAAFLAACGGGGSFDIEIVSDDRCNGLHIIEPAHLVELTVRGPGMSAITTDASGNEGAIEVPEVPEGSDRVVEVEVWATSGGRKVDLRARGASEPFDVSSDGAPRVRVHLYRTNLFSEVIGPDGSCAGMQAPRAGHAAAALSNDEVLLAGGYTSRREGAPDGILDSAEIFDLVAGRSKAVASMPSPRAEARAVALKDGRVLVVGGVMEHDGAVVPVADAMLFDGSNWKTLEMAHARRGHTATLIGQTGEVVVVGGVDAENQVVQPVEVFDPATDSFRELELAGEAALARAFHAAVAQGENSVVVVGGIDAEGKVTGDASIIVWHQAQQAFQATKRYTLDVPVMMPATLVLGSKADPKLVVAGGFTSYSAIPGEPGAGTPAGETNTVQYLDPLSGASRQTVEGGLSMSVAGACGVRLNPNRGVVTGGNRGSVVATEFGDLLYLESNRLQRAQAGEQNDRRPTARDLACTPIGTNGVLVTGGSGTDGTATDKAVVYLMKPSTQG